MVRVWYISGAEQGTTLTPQQLQLRTGVIHKKLDPKTYATDGSLEEIKNERGYSFEKEIDISQAALPDYFEKVKEFHKEHLHAEEEVRFVLSGTTFFDVRDSLDDSWIRIEVGSGDLIILPAGIYHRMTLTGTAPVRLLRLFLWKPTWSSYNRPADDLPCRLNYLHDLQLSLQHQLIHYEP